jgi:hypothetical protein
MHNWPAVEGSRWIRVRREEPMERETREGEHLAVVVVHSLPAPTGIDHHARERRGSERWKVESCSALESSMPEQGTRPSAGWSKGGVGPCLSS